MFNNLTKITMKTPEMGGQTPETNEVKTEVRELTPEVSWNGSVTVENLSEEEFAQKISEAVKELGFTYSGYRIPKGEEGFDYHFSRYPRRAFRPVAPVEKHQEALQKLAEKLETKGEEEKKTEQPRFRILLGLQEGYAEYKKHSIVERIGKEEITTLEEVKKVIESEIG